MPIARRRKKDLRSKMKQLHWQGDKSILAIGGGVVDRPEPLPFPGLGGGGGTDGSVGFGNAIGLTFDSNARDLAAANITELADATATAESPS